MLAVASLGGRRLRALGAMAYYRGMMRPIHIPSLSIFLGLTRIKGIGFKTMRDLGGPWGVAERHAEGALIPLVASLTGIPPGELGPLLLKLGSELRRSLKDHRVEIISQRDELYPAAFRSMSDDSQPQWLFCRGDLTLLSKPGVAVVGTREPTVEGDFLTKYATYAVQELGLSLVSGLALGVDGTAHETALRAGIPNVSVLGTGILRPYPARNLWMADAIVESGGLIISEYFPDAGPAGDQFVWRNRLQAALGSCVVAPQWKKSSGTAHTIRFAKSYGRPTINLVPNGLTPPHDHGQADHSFEVPRQHSQLMQCMFQAVDIWTQQRPVTQTSLFG